MFVAALLFKISPGPQSWMYENCYKISW